MNIAYEPRPAIVLTLSTSPLCFQLDNSANCFKLISIVFSHKTSGINSKTNQFTSVSLSYYVRHYKSISIFFYLSCFIYI